MTYLDVPYADKDEAKRLGARWDPEVRRWYAPDAAALQRLTRWLPKPALPEVLPREDRSFGSGLFVDLVPSSCWFTNVRSCVAKSEWDRVRTMVYGRAGYRCEACDRQPTRSPGDYIEAHERWSYDEATRTQTLVRLIALCSACHEVTHFGFAQLRGHEQRALAHLSRVTGMTRQQARQHVSDAVAVWQRRSALEWHLDLSMLTDAGIELSPPPDPAARRRAARDHPDRLA